MSHRNLLLLALSGLMTLALIFSGYMTFKPAGLPLVVKVDSARTLVIQPRLDIALAPGIQAGDRLELAAQSQAVRVMLGIILANNYATLPAGKTYEFVITRNGSQITAPVTSVDWFASKAVRWIMGLGLAFVICLFAIALLVLWRGRDRAAGGIAIWAIAIIFGHTFDTVPFDAMIGLALTWLAWGCYLVARIGFYVMIESMIETALTPLSKLIWRSGFLLTLCALVLLEFGGSAMLVFAGWAGFLRSYLAIILTASYILPIIMLLVSYHGAHTELRVRLRWMLWGSIVFVMGIYVSNHNAFGFLPSRILQNVFIVSAALIYAYIILRHRVVNISVFVDRTLVYGGVTALVVGILAAVNSLVQHATLGTGASLLVQIIVPLALGIVLGQVRNYTDKFVERVFFRQKYLAEKAVRCFAAHCEGYENTQELLKATVQNVHRKVHAPGVAIYHRKDAEYLAADREGNVVYPGSVKVDDAAFAAVRAGQRYVDLSEVSSALGTNGYVFTMGQQAALVCANRPGEHYAADERKLLVYVARQVGAALDALRMQEVMKRLEAKASLVDEVLAGSLPASAKLKARARELASVSVTT